MCTVIGCKMPWNQKYKNRGCGSGWPIFKKTLSICPERFQPLSVFVKVFCNSREGFPEFRITSLLHCHAVTKKQLVSSNTLIGRR